MNDHRPFEIRSSNEKVDTVIVSAPSIITEIEWYEIDEKPTEDYRAMCTCGKEHTSWGAALRCNNDDQ